MSDTRDSIVFMRNPKVSTMAKIQLGLGIATVLLMIIVILAGIPVLLPLSAGILLIVTASIILGREQMPICTIGDNALEFKNPAPLASLQLIPLNSIQSVSRQKQRFVVETTHQRKPVYMSIELFRPEEVERVWAVLNDLVKPQKQEAAA